MSEGNQGPGVRRPPVMEDDDRPTAEIPVVPPAGDGVEGPTSGSPSRPASSGPAAGSNRQDVKDGPAPAQPAAAQPSASGWTPPPLGGRQAPQPPPVKPAAAPPPTSGSARPTAPPTAATPSAGRSSAGPRPAPGRPAGPPARPPAASADPGKGAAVAAAASSPATADASPPASEPDKASPSASGAKVPFWHKVTDALGFDRKSGSGTAAAEVTDRAPADGGAPAAPAAAEAAARSVQPGPSAPAPAGPVPSAAKGPRPETSSARTGVPASAPTHPGPPQYRVGTPPQAPAGTVRPGVAAGAGAAGATALQLGATAGQGPRGGETQTGAAKPPARRTRKARLRLSRLDPWSVMKTSFLFAIAAGIMLVVAVYAIWVVLSASGLFASINDIVASVVSTPGDTTPFQIQDYLDTQRVMGIAALLACVDVVIFTALATLASFLYNLAATMLGGLEVTLAED